MSDNIVVALRVRPLIAREIPDAHKLYWKVENNHIIQFDPDSKQNIQSYEFDKVFDSDVTSHEIYKEVAFPIVQSVLAGINGTIFAYGQTSSGKTFTMTGDKASPGIIPLSISDIFQSIENTPDREFLLRASYMEIYQENISDLLTGQKISSLREDSSGCVYVPGLKEECVTNENKLLSVMADGDKRRKVAETNMNERSSRSHSIFRLIVESKNANDNECDGIVTVSHLNLVDLAGSENATQTGATGERLKEGSSINKSLFMLGRVISQLSDGESYVNFRDSKLTRILQTSIGGNAKTAMICTITPANKEQSLSSVRFASRAKSIKNKPIVNEVMSEAALLKRYAMEINKLKSALENERNTDKAQEVEQVKEKLDEQERQNFELQEKLKSLKEKLVVSSLKKDQTSFKEKKTRRETWAAPAIKRFRGSEFNLSTEFLKPLPWSSTSLKFSPVSEEESIDTISPLDPKLTSPDQNNSLISVASFHSPSESILHKNEISKLEGMDSSFLSPERLPKRYKHRKCVNFSSSVLVWPNFKDAECQTDNSLLPKSQSVEQLTPRSNKFHEIIKTPPGVTPRQILRSRNRELKESLEQKEGWLENWNCEIRELSEFQKNEIRLLNESFRKKEGDGPTDDKVKALEDEVKSLRRSLQDSEQLYLDVNRANSGHVQEIKQLNEQLKLLTQERNKYFKSHEESIMLSELNVKLKKSLEEKERNLVSLQHDKQDFDIRMELALQKQKQVENDLRLCLEESWADIASLDGTSKLDVQKRLQEILEIKNENSSLKYELNEYKSKEDILLSKMKHLETQLKKYENHLTIKNYHNEVFHSEIQNLQDGFTNIECKRLKSEDSEDFYSPLWTTAREKSEFEVSRMSTSYAVNPSEMSQKLSETINSLEEFGLSSIVKQLNYLPLDPFDTTAIDIFKEMLLKLQDYYSSLEQQVNSPLVFPVAEKNVYDSLMLSNSSFNHEIIQDYALTLTTWNLLDSICYDYYNHCLEKINIENVLVKSDCVIEKAFKLGLTKLQESFNESKDFMRHIDFESFMDEESSFLNDHIVANNDGQPILSLADELKMLNDSNSEGDVGCVPNADDTIIEINKNTLFMEISQLQKNEEKYKAEILSLVEKVKLLESHLLLLQTSNDAALCDFERLDNDQSSPLPQKSLNDNESVYENCTIEVEKLKEKYKLLEEQMVALKHVKNAYSSPPVTTNNGSIELKDLKDDSKFEEEILELKKAIALSQSDLSELLPFKNKFNEQVILNDKLRRELVCFKCNCVKEASTRSLNCSLSDRRDINDRTMADCENTVLQCNISKFACSPEMGKNIYFSETQDMKNCTELDILKPTLCASAEVSEGKLMGLINHVIEEDNKIICVEKLSHSIDVREIENSEEIFNVKESYVMNKYQIEILELKNELKASREKISKLFALRDKYNEQNRVINELINKLERAKCNSLLETSVSNAIINSSICHDSPCTSKIRDKSCSFDGKQLEFIMEKELVPIKRLNEPDCNNMDEMNNIITDEDKMITYMEKSLLSSSEIKKDTCETCMLKNEHLNFEIHNYKAEIYSLEKIIKSLEYNKLQQQTLQDTTSNSLGDNNNKSRAIVRKSLSETEEKSELHEKDCTFNHDKNVLDSEFVKFTEGCSIHEEQQIVELENVYSSTAEITKNDAIELKALKVSKCAEDILSSNHAFTVSPAKTRNEELKLHLKEKQTELDIIKQQLDININNYSLQVADLEQIISDKNSEIKLLNQSLQSHLNKENDVDELVIKHPSVGNNKRDEIVDFRNSPAKNLLDESELISLKEKCEMQKVTIVELRKELEEYKDKEGELESMITDFTIKEAELEDKEASLKELESKLQEMEEENKISSLKLTAEIADKENIIKELKEVILLFQQNKNNITSNNFNDSFKEAIELNLKNVQNDQCIDINKEVPTLTCETEQNTELSKMQNDNLSHDFEQLFQYLIDCNVISANDIEKSNFPNGEESVKTPSLKHEKVIIKLQDYINYCQTELMETSKVETLLSEQKQKIFNLENSLKELESCLDSKEKCIENLSSSIIEKDANLLKQQKLREAIMTVFENVCSDCDDNELVQKICNWKLQMESKVQHFELSKAETDDLVSQLEDECNRRSLEIDSLKEILQKEASKAQSHADELNIKINLIETLKVKEIDLECNIREMELQLSSIYELQQEMELKNKDILRLQEKCCNLDSTLSLKKQEIIQLKENNDDQVRNLLTALKNEEIRVSELSECLSTQDEKLNRTENVNKETFSINETLQNKIDKLENTIQDRCNMIDRLLEEKSEQESTVSNLKGELLILKSNYDEFISEKQTVAQELLIRQEKIEELSKTFKVLQSDKEMTESKTSTIADSYNAAQVELQNQRNLLSIKGDKIKELQNDLNSLDEEHLKCGLEIENLIKLIENYKIDVAKKDSEIEKLATEKDAIESKLKNNAEEVQKLSMEIGTKLDILKSFEARETLYKKEIEILSLSDEKCKRQLKEVEIKSEEIQSQNTKLLEEIQLMQQVNHNIYQVQDSLKEELKKEVEKNLDYVKILSENEKLKLAIKYSEAEMEILLVENKKNIGIIKNLELVIEKLQSIEQELTKQIKDAENIANEHNGKKQSLLEKIRLLKQENEELSKLNDSIKAELNDVRHKNTDANELNNENEKLKSSLKIVESNTEELNSQNKKLKEELHSLMQENKDLCKLSDTIKAELRKANKQNSYCEKLMLENEKLKLVVENLELESETLNSENKKNIQTIKNLELEITKLQLSEKELLERVKKIESSADKFSKHNKTLLEDFQSLQHENIELYKVNDSLKGELQTVTKQNVDSVKLLSENEKLKLVIENVESELETLNFENKKNVQIIKDYEFENNKLNLMEQELKCQLNEAENKINEFNCLNEELLDKVQSLQQTNKNPSKLFDSFKSELLEGSEKTLDSGKLKLENQKLKLMIEKIESESLDLLLKNNDNIATIKNLEYNIEILDIREKDIKVELQTAKASVDELINKNQKLLEKIQSTLLENDRLYKLLEATKIELQDKIDECKALDKELDETISEYKISHSYVEIKCSKFKSQIQQLEKEKFQLNETLSSFASNTSLTYQKRGGTATPNSDIISIAEDNSNAVIICEDLKSHISDPEKENLSLIYKLSENSHLFCLGDKARDDSELKFQCDRLLQKNKELTELLETTQNELASKAEECKALDKELDDTISEYKKTQSYVNDINAELKNKVQELEKDKSSLSETLTCQSNHILLDYSSRQNKNTTAVDSYHDFSALEIKHLEKEFHILKSENEKLITEVNSLRNSYSAKLKEIAALHSRSTKLESEIEIFTRSSNGVDFKEHQKEYVALQEKYARFDGMEECQLEDMHQHYLKASTNSKCKEEKYDSSNKELKERYFEIERENNVLKMNLDALNAPAVKEAKKLKECLESEAMKNKHLMRELRRLQNMKNTSICEPSASKKIESKTVPQRDFDEGPASLNCGSQIVCDVQVMRLKNENYHLEREKTSLQQENKLVKEHLEHYMLKGREWKTKCYKESMALKKMEVENKSLTDKLNALYMKQSKCPSQLNEEKIKDPSPRVQVAKHLQQSTQPPLQQISTNKTSEKFVSSVATEVEKAERRKVEKENHGRVSASSSQMSNLAKEEDCKTQ